MVLRELRVLRGYLLVLQVLQEMALQALREHLQLQELVHTELQELVAVTEQREHPHQVERLQPQERAVRMVLREHLQQAAQRGLTEAQVHLRHRVQVACRVLQVQAHRQVHQVLHTVQRVLVVLLLAQRVLRVLQGFLLVLQVQRVLREHLQQAAQADLALQAQVA
jgi:hypothetical protein